MHEAIERDDETQEAQRVLHEHLNSLLAQWHGWCASQKEVDGYKKQSAAFLDALTSRQYDDANGALDAHVDVVLMEAVDAVIDRIIDPWRTALAIQARNLWTGKAVWNSPRLPSCQMARTQILVEARKKFVDALATASLL
jgi:hypothetical protein